MTDWIETYFVPLLLVGAMILGACTPIERPRAPYQVGEIVCVKLTGERGMVTSVFNRSVYVRVSSAVTSNQTFAPRSYPMIMFENFEVEKCR